MENAIAKKLLIKPAFRVLLVNAPAGYENLLDPLPREVQLTHIAEGSYDLIQLFSKNSRELSEDLKWLQAHLRPDTILWISYPKKNSAIETDLGMMMSWDETSKHGLEPVASAAIDETWTALRFKAQDQVKRSAIGNAAIAKNEYGEFVDVINRIVKLPSYLKTELEKAPAALTFFNSLSYSCKKEYVLWILTAKQEKTRTERIAKMIEKLLQGKKTPASK